MVASSRITIVFVNNCNHYTNDDPRCQHFWETNVTFCVLHKKQGWNLFVLPKAGSTDKEQWKEAGRVPARYRYQPWDVGTMAHAWQYSERGDNTKNRRLLRRIGGVSSRQGR
nr:MAG TPA: PPPDE putative peptidase domain [Caudoviricetes sp.]